MGVAAAQVGFDHEAGKDVRIASGKAGGFEGPFDERGQRGRLNARHITAAVWFLLCDGLLGHFPSGLLYLPLCQLDRRWITTAFSASPPGDHVTATRSLLIWSSRAVPQSAMVRTSSVRRWSSTARTPSDPSSASPQIAGRAIRTARAPSASALTMS